MSELPRFRFHAQHVGGPRFYGPVSSPRAVDKVSSALSVNCVNIEEIRQVSSRVW
jgi:hypothetical protein